MLRSVPFVRSAIYQCKNTGASSGCNYWYTHGMTEGDELKEARAQAHQAQALATRAIMLAVFAIIVAAAMPFVSAHWLTQTVRLDDDQLRSINFISTSAAGKQE